MGLRLGLPKTRKHRFQLIRTKPEDEQASFAEDVRDGLSAPAKHLSCRFLYDQRGSRLFDAICELPEYYPTRCERQILAENSESIAEAFPHCQTLVELGSGSASKTRLLLNAFHESRSRIRYVPIDISPVPLVESSEMLLGEFVRLSIVGIAAEYRQAFSLLDTHARSPRLILWLGSSIGNFDPESAAHFLRELVGRVGPQDRFLIGMDLRKDKQVLQRAYDDQQGITAEFNKNLLHRINRELGGNFDLEGFEHQAIYNDELGRVEMHLRSTKAQRVTIDCLKLEVDFSEGETIHTENSYKFTHEGIEQVGRESGLTLQRQWFDAYNRFSLNLFAKSEAEG